MTHAKLGFLHNFYFYFDNKGIVFSTILRLGILIVSYISLVKFEVKQTSHIFSLVHTIDYVPSGFSPLNFLACIHFYPL